MSRIATIFHRLKHHKRRLGVAVAAAAVLWLAVFVYNVYKPLPQGVGTAGALHPTDVEFLHDLTYRRGGDLAMEQQIFDRVFRLIDDAEEFVVIDMFLFNSEHGGERPYRPLTQDLTDHLIAAKRARPEMPIAFLTDEINNFYGAYTAPEITRLRENGIDVVTTRLTRLRDSNPLYSSLWRILPRWLGTGGPGFLPHPLSSTGRKVTARSYLKLLNFKANHRKLIVTEDGCLIASANPHDASSFHSNIAFAARGAVCNDVLASERAVARFSGGAIGEHEVAPDTAPGTVRAQFVTEGRIREALLAALEASGPGDRVDLAMFYLAERHMVGALLEAARRGAAIRVVLDPNKDAFGREKGGVPNRQVAWELVTRSEGDIQVRWFDTHGEQFHTKLVAIATPDSVVVFGGSANLTRRNIGDYNLEADLRIVAPPDAHLVEAVREYFERIWTNRDGHFTLEFDAYRDDGWLKRVMYRLQEFTGLSSF